MRKLTLGMAAVAALASAPAFAATTSGTMQVMVNVDNICSLSTQSLDFGSISDFTVAHTAASATTLKCTPTASADVTITNGATFSAGARHMASGANQISYAINDAGGAAWVSKNFVGNGNAVNIGINGVIPVQTAVPAGSYLDTVTINVAY